MKNNIYKKRIQNVFNEMPKCDTILLFNEDSGVPDKNFLYVTGLTGSTFQGCAVLLTRDGKVILFTQRLDEELCKTGYYTEFQVWKNKTIREQMLKGILYTYNRTCIGLCYDYIAYSRLQLFEILNPNTSWINVSNAFTKVRMIKSKDELERIQKACDIVSKVSFLIPELLKEGMTELNLVTEVNYLIRKKGANGIAFNTIVAFGVNTSKPHYGASICKLKKNDIILVDFGAEVIDYKSDITQMYFFGKSDKDKRYLYDTVFTAENFGIELIKNGVTSKEVDEKVRKYINNYNKYKDRFIHALGHGLGLDVHDHIYPKVFKTGMVLAIEPGIYLPGLYGMRLEDDILVTKNGCRRLTSTMKYIQ